MIAVTGAAGFIGSNLAHALAADGADLLLVDHPLTAAKAPNLIGLPRYSFSEHDGFLDDLDADRVRPEAVFHLGACSATTETDWAYLRRNNLEYTQRLWAWCARRGVPFVYASSAATYGDGSRGFDDRTPPAELEPLNLYGRSKNEFDVWALAEVAAGRPAPPRWAGLKFFNVYGPREGHKQRMASVAWQAYRQIHTSGQVRLFRSAHPDYPDGGQLRDFVFVDDCVRHMLWLWRNDHPGGVYNSGTGTPRSFLDLATAVFLAMGLPPNISFIDMPADLARQYQNYTRATTDKLRGVGCELPPTPLEIGVRRYVAWMGNSDGLWPNAEAAGPGTLYRSDPLRRSA
jgi:ADP-L-glycero-D-manno-heptose 6-epimerase